MNRHSMLARFIFLTLCMAYVWVGYKEVPFHGDEADHLFKSQDYVTYFVEHRPQNLQVAPLVAIDSPEHIRLLTGTTTAYVVGYALWSDGVWDWPKPWYYGLDVQWNREDGRWPSEKVLQRGRIATTLLAMLAVPLAYGVVLRWGQNEVSARTATFLVITHPAWLLSSRRVMQEAALITLSLLIVILAMIWVQKRHLSWGIAIGVASGFCLAAKPTGGITVGLVFVALGIVQRRFLSLAFCGCLAGIVYLVLTPAIWGSPLDRLHLAVQMRAEVLEGQTKASGVGYDHLGERFVALLKQPFLTDLQYYESPAFEGVIDEQIAYYETHHLAGWQMSQIIGWLWMGVAGLGLMSLLRKWREPPVFMGVFWVVGTGLALAVSVPLAWQRYYLLWSLAICLLAGIGTGFMWQEARKYVDG